MKSAKRGGVAEGGGCEEGLHESLEILQSLQAVPSGQVNL